MCGIVCVMGYMHLYDGALALRLLLYRIHRSHTFLRLRIAGDCVSDVTGLMPLPNCGVAGGCATFWWSVRWPIPRIAWTGWNAARRG